MISDMIWHLVPYLYGIQALLGLIVMGLDAYGIQSVVYNVLIYSLVVAICTVITCAYLVVLQRYPKPWHNNVSLAYSLWMFVFWLINLGLIMDLTTSLAGLTCDDDLDEGIDCGKAGSSDANKRYVEPKTSSITHHGALIAGCALAALQVILWGITVAIFWFKCHEVASTAAEMRTYDFELRVIRQPLQPTTMRVPISPESPRLNPRRVSEVTVGAQSAAMTINFDDKMPGLQRIGPEPIIPDDSASEGTLRHVAEELRRQPRGPGTNSVVTSSERIDGGEKIGVQPQVGKARESIAARRGVRAMKFSEDENEASRIDDVPL